MESGLFGMGSRDEVIDTYTLMDRKLLLFPLRP